ncbi:MAG: hypothetical protein H0X01_01075 [Nitrospira sp.]|nr:hypothetical protein [Nitrospira sp.]
MSDNALYGRHIIFRAGRPSPSNLRPRPVDKGHLSFRASISNPQYEEAIVFEIGEPYFHVDTSMLPPEKVIRDDDPPGHVSVVDVDEETLKNAVVGKGNGKTI